MEWLLQMITLYWHIKVKDIIDQSHKVWNAPLIFNLFDPNTAQFILNTPFAPVG